MKIAMLIFLVLLLILIALVYFTTYHPSDVEEEFVVCPDNAPVLSPGQSFKILSWNVQFMAGKNYVFYYDLPDFAGPDERPSSEDITITINRVAEIIKDENPDIILLQEVDVGAKRTDYEDQIERLLSLLPDDYVCHASSWYWKAAYVPHPRIKGKVGMKLVTISKYKIDKAVRYQLPQMPADPLTRQFNIKRCLLECRLPVRTGSWLTVMNTHLDAFAQGNDTMEKQVGLVYTILDTLESGGVPWILGGDFNLLPPGQFKLVPRDEQRLFNQQSELEILTDRFAVFPRVDDAIGPHSARWYTHFPNDPKIDRPSKTIDYIFYASSVQLDSALVRQHDTLEISDHLPLVANFRLPD